MVVFQVVLECECDTRLTRDYSIAPTLEEMEKQIVLAEELGYQVVTKHIQRLEYEHENKIK